MFFLFFTEYMVWHLIQIVSFLWKDIATPYLMIESQCKVLFKAWNIRATELIMQSCFFPGALDQFHAVWWTTKEFILFI